MSITIDSVKIEGHFQVSNSADGENYTRGETQKKQIRKTGEMHTGEDRGKGLWYGRCPMDFDLRYTPIDLVSVQLLTVSDRRRDLCVLLYLRHYVLN